MTLENRIEIVDKWTDELMSCEYLLIGLGTEWDSRRCPDVALAYEKLYRLAKDRDYFVVTTVTDGCILKTRLSSDRIVAPCGNENWRQCSKGCTKDIWEEGEIADDICPHCGSPLTGNTFRSDVYIEEGYLTQWKAYKDWLAHTLNRKLLVLELGVDLKVPSVIRWPFEKTVFFNQKSHMYRINGTLYQIPEDIRDRTVAVPENSVEFVRKFVDF